VKGEMKMIRLKSVSTACLLRLKRQIRRTWRESAQTYPDGCWPNEKLYDVITNELRLRGVA